MQFFICRRRLFSCKTTPPSNLSLPDGGLCRDTKRPCKETNIFGYLQSEPGYVKFERFEVKEGKIF